MRLARTVPELEATVDAHEFEEWRIFDYFEPIGDVRFDVLNGYIGRAIAAAVGVRSVAADFVPQWAKWIEEFTPNTELESARIVSGMISMARDAGLPVNFLTNG